MLAIDFSDLDDGDIKRTTTQIINSNSLVTALLVHAISKGGGGRLVDDAFDVEASDTTCIFGCLTL